MEAHTDRDASCCNTITEALAALRQGKPVVVMDDLDRENEACRGDLVVAAEFATKESLAFMCRHSSGLLCAPITEQRARELDLAPMVTTNTDRNSTAFTVSIDVLEGTTTGASAGDRALTARALTSASATPASFSRPGHLFPLVARDGGVLVRNGHTEASVDLCRLAGLQPAAVIAELMHPCGDMMRFDACRQFASTHDLPIITIADLQVYVRDQQQQRQYEEATEKQEPGHTALNTNLPDSVLVKVYREVGTDLEHVALVKGDIANKPDVLTRVHSVCLTGDVFHSLRCDCGPQLQAALAQIDTAGCGVLVYMRGHEGRGIGLGNKIKAYAQQQQHRLDTYQANESLGFPSDLRTYEIADAILHSLRPASVCLLTNNPLKPTALARVRVSHVKQLRLAPSLTSAAYVLAKHKREQEIATALRSTVVGGSAGDLAAIVADDNCKDTRNNDGSSSSNNNNNNSSGNRCVVDEDHLHDSSRGSTASPNTNASSPTPASTPVASIGGDVSGVAVTVSSAVTNASCFSNANNVTTSSIDTTTTTTTTTTSGSSKGLLASSPALELPPHVLDCLQANATQVPAAVDELFMRRALSLARLGRVSAPPNPWVGCVLVRDGHVIGEGYHRRAGMPHAEIEAMADAVLRAGIDIMEHGGAAAALADTPFAAFANTAAAQTHRLLQRGKSKRAASEAKSTTAKTPSACTLTTATGVVEAVRAVLAGATAYVTLEPCHHQGRTGPCDQALVQAGVARTVIAVTDPDERVSARGLAFLRSRGVEVATGVCGAEAEALLAPYLHQRRTGRPLCVIKTAISIDGRVACKDATSKWITGPLARARAHKMRAESQAVLCGIGTALADNPTLNVRLALASLPPGERAAFAPAMHAASPSPVTVAGAGAHFGRGMPLVRVVLDARGRLFEGRLLDTSIAPTIVYTSRDCSAQALKTWAAHGVEAVVVDTACASGYAGACRGVDTRVGGDAAAPVLLDLMQVLRDLAKRGVLQVLVEGGAQVHSSFVQQGLGDQLAVFVGPKLLGGTAVPWLPDELASTMAHARTYSLVRVETFAAAARQQQGDGTDSSEHKQGKEVSTGGDILCVYRKAD
ncbi:riboflavin biosynthesis protein RibA [Salpingoeca rosetta]|uniref:Riboflavin biosynthesis protein RibA n=1 Tax=Salpingoeca rosetta (strain ATCC 50818 / BSB-021) TaxID=946362 RepID=F2TVP0_SALR5|nr:riboflavin biosynthesis protein RibA [Salpingoeca rosetta]EGD72136.1 riboflavin biosynthesis protein RibA [Salpingoeca rosetta]|eukprot:XP_004998708.1 riboflavin biosynthesis protein RibA [Salpingoeca rosetta]